VTSTARIQCVGGPIDGCMVPADRMGFPWPEGWYYNHGDRYVWQGECWIEPDAATWVAEILPWAAPVEQREPNP